MLKIKKINWKNNYLDVFLNKKNILKKHYWIPLLILVLIMSWTSLSISIHEMMKVINNNQSIQDITTIYSLLFFFFFIELNNKYIELHNW
jgi:hypothetical protein